MTTTSVVLLDNIAIKDLRIYIHIVHKVPTSKKTLRPRFLGTYRIFKLTILILTETSRDLVFAR